MAQLTSVMHLAIYLVTSSAAVAAVAAKVMCVKVPTYVTT